MNKQELIKKIQEHIAENDECMTNHRSPDHEFMASVSNTEWHSALKYAYQLDEPQKVKVPQFVAAWIEQAKKECRTFFEVLSDIEGACFYHKGDEPTYKWVFDNDNGVKHQEIFARAWLDGYEVEEEPKYYVNIGDLYLKEPLGDTSDFTISMTWNREYAYPFDSWNMAREHASKLGGTVEKV